MLRKIILLAGPTGVGKTALSLELAERLGTEIVNADSMQVYRYMDIGTAKPTAEERSRVRHHLLDVVDPDESFDSAHFVELATPVLDALHGQGKIPLVVGGTGLYMKVLTRGICAGAPGDPVIREMLLHEEQERGLGALHAELLQVDPVLGKKFHSNDRQRIIRALEVFRLTGKPLSHWQAEHRFAQTLYPSIKIFLFREREEIYDRINRRVLSMMEQGFLEEVRSLLERGYDPGLKPVQSLGYKEMTQHLLGKCSLDEAVDQTQRESRRYAKRQMTWFRGDPEFKWLKAEAEEEIGDAVSRLIGESVSR